MNVILKAENISKQYRLGEVGTGTLSHDLNRWWASMRGKEDPYLKVGAMNDRSAKAKEDYVWALRDINFEVKQGEVLGIIGKNGAGKSTLLKLLSRVTSPTTGTIKTKGRIASLLEIGTGFHPELSGRENIFMNGAVLGMTKNEIRRKLDEIIDFSGCEMYIDTPVKRYSSGMKVRLGFAVAAHLEPEILVIDEVLAVGDAEFQKKAIGKMQDLSIGQGRTVLFVSHNMASVNNLCTRAILLENGHNVFEGSASEVVDFYISGRSMTVQKEVFFNENHRKFKPHDNLELKMITIENRNMSVREDLLFTVAFNVKNKMTEKICLTGSICSIDDTRIGSFFSNSFVPNNGSNRTELKIFNHNLGPGSYYLNISVSTGTVQQDNLKMLDHAYESIAFQITRELENSVHLTQWNSNWGKLFLESKVKLKDDEL